MLSFVLGSVLVDAQSKDLCNGEFYGKGECEEVIGCKWISHVFTDDSSGLCRVASVGENDYAKCLQCAGLDMAYQPDVGACTQQCELVTMECLTDCALSLKTTDGGEEIEGALKNGDSTQDTIFILGVEVNYTMFFCGLIGLCLLVVLVVGALVYYFCYWKKSNQQGSSRSGKTNPPRGIPQSMVSLNKNTPSGSSQKASLTHRSASAQNFHSSSSRKTPSSVVGYQEKKDVNSLRYRTSNEKTTDRSSKSRSRPSQKGSSAHTSKRSSRKGESSTRLNAKLNKHAKE